MERSEFYQSLFERAKAAGFSACEAYYAAGESFSVTVFGGEITDYSASESRGLGFRGLVDGRMGYASTQALDEDSIALLVEGARENARLIECEDEQFLFAGAEEYADVCNYNPDIDQVSVAEKIGLCKSLETMAAGMDARLRREAEASVFSESGEVEIVNTLGLHVGHRANIIGGYVQPVAEENGRVSSGFSLFFENDPAKIDAEKTVREAVKEAVDGLSAASVPSGSYRVLLRNDVAAQMLRAFSGVFSADRAQKGLSLLKGREGEKIAAECLTIVDDPHLPGQAASTPFDGEGVPTFRKEVVSGGVLKTLLHNLKTAKKQGVETTANACRGGYGSPVGVAPSNFCVQPSNLAFEDMLDLLGDGLLITDLQGWHAGADAVSGDFSLPARGYRVENGKIAGSVNQITLAGNFFELLKSVEAVSGDLKFSAPSASAFASPSLLIPSLSVAGK